MGTNYHSWHKRENFENGRRSPLNESAERDQVLRTYCEPVLIESQFSPLKGLRSQNPTWNSTISLSLLERGSTVDRHCSMAPIFEYFVVCGIGPEIRTLDGDKGFHGNGVMYLPSLLDQYPPLNHSLYPSPPPQLSTVSTSTMAATMARTSLVFLINLFFTY